MLTSGIQRTGYIDIDIDINDAGIDMLKAIDAVNGDEVAHPSDRKLCLKTKARVDLAKVSRVWLERRSLIQGLETR